MDFLLVLNVNVYIYGSLIIVDESETHPTSWIICDDFPDSGVSVLIVEVINERLGAEHLARVEEAHERVGDGPTEAGGVTCC